MLAIRKFNLRTFIAIQRSGPSRIFSPPNIFRYMVLMNSVLKSDDLVFTQLCGVALGKTLAQVLATNYIAELEGNYIQTRRKNPLL